MSTADMINTGVLMGLIHVLTGPDHLSALATLSGTDIYSSDDDSSITGSSGNHQIESFLLGIKWGVGHSAGLLVVGGILIASESYSDTIHMESSWSVVFESFVGVFMLLLGCYGLRRAIKHKREKTTIPPVSWPSRSDKLKRSTEECESDDSEEEEVAVQVVNMPKPQVYSSSRSRDSLTQRMEEALEFDNSQHEHEERIIPPEMPLHNISEVTNESASEDESTIRHVAGRGRGRGAGGRTGTRRSGANRKASRGCRTGLADSFVRYKARTPTTLRRATSIMKLHATPEKSIVWARPSRFLRPLLFGPCSSVCTTHSLLALLAGVVQGVAGPGGVLGVVPAVQLRNPWLASVYLGTFCVTSTLVMGGFAAFYGTFSEWLAGGRRKESGGGDRVFVVEAGSASLSVAVGVVWLVLVTTGKMEDLFLFDT